MIFANFYNSWNILIWSEKTRQSSAFSALLEEEINQMYLGSAYGLEIRLWLPLLEKENSDWSCSRPEQSR